MKNGSKMKPARSRKIVSLTTIAIAALAPIAIGPCSYAQQGRPPGNVFWSGESNGFKITWSGSDLIAQKDAVVAFSARAFARQGLAHFVSAVKDPTTGKVPSCVYERRFRLVAVVGTLMSFSDRYYSSCEKEAHPGGETRFTTIDLAKHGGVAYKGPDSFGEIEPSQPGMAVRLTDIFPEQDVYERLRADPLMTKTLDANTGEPTPRTLPELMKTLSGQRGRDQNCFVIPNDLLTRFAFYHVVDGRIEMQLGLPGDGPCRDDLTQVGLLFSIPSNLKIPLEHAITGGAAGVLMKDVDRKTGESETIVRLRTGRGTK